MADKILKFGDYTFPEGLSVGSISAGARVNKSEIPGRPGVHIGPRVIGEKMVKLEGVIWSDDLRSTMDALQSALAVGKAQLYVEDDRYIRAVCEDFTHDYDPGAFQDWVNVQLGFTADPPFWVSETEQTQQWDAPSTSVSITQTAGNVYVEPIIEVKFATSGNVDLDLGIGTAASCSLIGAVTADLVVQLDCEAKTVLTAGGVDKMALFEGTFPRLEPDDTTLFYAHNSGPALSYIKLIWRARWY